MTTLDTARLLRAANVSCIPVKRDKRPTIKWARYRETLPSEDELAVWFANGAAIAIVGGSVQCLDIDCKNAPDGPGLFDRFAERCQEFGLTDLVQRCVIQSTCNQGVHLVWTCQADLRNLKLAEATTGEVLIETRGAGGYFLIAPSPGYTLMHGDWSCIPELSEEERDCLLSAARSLTEKKLGSPTVPSGLDVTPGDDFDRRGDLFGLLERHGWVKVAGDGSTWRRPGKSSGVSATFSRPHNRFYCWTTSTTFEAPNAYRPFAVFAVLECDGDFHEAARRLSAQGYGARQPPERANPPPQGPRQRQAPARAADRPLVDLPPFEDYDPAEAETIQIPEVIVQGLMHRGEKATIIGGSKSQKTFCLLQLAVAATCGQKWLGRDVTPGDVLFVNFELQRAFCLKRIAAIQAAMKGEPRHHLRLWHLRGHQVSAFILVQTLIERIQAWDYVLIILDPLYKLLAGLNENDASEMGQLLGELEKLVSQRECGLIYSDHTPKGDLSQRDHIDLASGSGVKARDPDGLVTLRKHADWEELNRLYVLESTARNCPPVPPATVRFDYPCYSLIDIEPALPNPKAGRKQEVSDRELLVPIDDLYDGVSYQQWADLLEGKLTRASIIRRAKDLRRQGLIITLGSGQESRQCITDKGHDLCVTK